MDGTVNIAVTEVVVTYIKPAVGSDPAGFFVQREQAGPAVFVAVEPSLLALDPVLAVGDIVSFTATSVVTDYQQRRVSALVDPVRMSQGYDVTLLEQNITAVSGVTADDYQSELITIYDAQLRDTDGLWDGAGTDHSKVKLYTAGHPYADPDVTNINNLEFRVPNSVRDSLSLTDPDGCTLDIVSTPLWQRDDWAQVSIWANGDASNIRCPAPKLIGASPSSGTALTVTFDRELDPQSVLANGSQFSFTGGLTASGASATARTVELTTSAQTSGVGYTVTVADTVTSRLGDAVDTMANSFLFTGAGGCQPLVISQIYSGGGNTSATYKNDYVEIHNRGSIALNFGSYSIQYASATGSSWNNNKVTFGVTQSLGAGEYLLVQLAVGDTGVDLPVSADETGSTNMSATSGKIALVAANITLSGACPDSGTYLDLVGYGTSATCSEGASNAPGPGDNTQAIFRNTDSMGGTDGCYDTNSNGSDFSTGPANPRNKMSNNVTCTTCP
jgi:hypothetical protein